MTSQITIVNPTLNVMDIHNMLFEHPLHVLFPFPNCYPKLSARKCRWPQFPSSRQDCHVIASCKIIVTSWHKQPLRLCPFPFSNNLFDYVLFLFHHRNGYLNRFVTIFLQVVSGYTLFLPQDVCSKQFLHIWKNVLWLHILYWEWEEDAFPEICQKFLRYRDSSRGLRENRRTMNSGITIPEKLVLNR
jgi:hypothetical protein